MNNIKKITAAEEKGLGFEQLETVCGGEAESAAVNNEERSIRNRQPEQSILRR